jgi:RNA polymerase-binding protein DksA
MATDINTIRTQLEKERSRVAEELRQMESSGSGSEERREGSPFGKREEEATETMELEKRLTLENRLREQLSEIDHALKKFEAGTYGLCEVCGQPIAPARLEALPQAKLCMNCKAQQSKNSKPKPPAV